MGRGKGRWKGKEGDGGGFNRGILVIGGGMDDKIIYVCTPTLDTALRYRLKRKERKKERK